jgi:pantoate--beta-alanine ligase
VGDLRAALAPERRAGRTIGLVPTMGALHEGHISLVRAARAECDVVVVSLFVNPAQFDERADLERYPRSEARDAELARAAGADVLFAPTVEEVYPEGFATAVEVLGVTDRLEGAVRGPAHFRGVATVVTKLLGMVGPDVAYFGQKDAQQVAVLRRLVADLDLPVRVTVCPTVREADGLAMSSRNALLTPDQRDAARGLPAGLRAACDRVGTGERQSEALIGAAAGAMARFDATPEYVAIVDPDTFEPLTALTKPALLVLAARVGTVRLIDNVVLTPTATPDTNPDLQPIGARTRIKISAGIEAVVPRRQMPPTMLDRPPAPVTGLCSCPASAIHCPTPLNPPSISTRS